MRIHLWPVAISAFLMLSLSACSREDPAAPMKKWTFRISTDAVAVKGAPEQELSKRGFCRHRRPIGQRQKKLQLMAV